MRLKLPVILFAIIAVGLAACNSKPSAKAKPVVTYKGLYSFGPDIKSFKECASGREFWVTDSSAELELKYSELGFQKPDEASFIEVQGHKIKTDKNGMGADYDSTLVVTKLIKITKELPANGCN